nr:hypothetical protein [uncultured Rhodopila sp.]
MRFRALLAGGVLAAAAFAPAAQAATITTSLAAWAAAVSDYSTTSNTGLALYSSVTSIPLSDGVTLTVDGAGDTVLRPLSGWGPWSDGYTGDIIDTAVKSETIRFSGLNALGVELSPDFGLFGADAETFTVTLSDGTTTQISGSYPQGTTQFVGFYGAGVNSITIAAANAPDFAFGAFVDAPEPLSVSLLLVGLAGLGAVRRHARNI